jgi:hypothetical protein
MTATEIDRESSTPPKAHKHRSPAYPAIGLKEAIEKASVLHDCEDRHYAPLDALSAHWEIKQSNSSIQGIISALKQFGLLEEQGSGESRQFRVTDLALDILTYEHDPPKQAGAIRQAALKPAIHQELWAKYGGKLPSDPNIKAYLTREREPIKFNKKHVEGFIAQFRDTLAFAKVVNDDINAAQDVNVEPAARTTVPVTQREKRERKPMASGSKEDVFSLDEGAVIVQWPERIRGASAEDIADWLKLVGNKIKRAVDDSDDDPEDDSAESDA